MSIYCEISDLITESDVEQKFIYPLLTNEAPAGLGYKPSDIKTKQILRQILIDKGSKQRYYFPDYVLSLRGIPVAVVEAKVPNDDLAKAFFEARLYANEINSAFKHKLNICQKVLICNGLEIWAGYYDQADPVFKVKFDEVFVGSKSLVELIEFCSKTTLTQIVDKYYADIKGRAIFNTPVSKLGGKRVQDQELIENAYGRTLVFENGNIFDPKTEEDRTEIVKNAYVSSAKKEQHTEPLYKEIKKFILPSEVNSTHISTEIPDAVVDKISKHLECKSNNYSLMIFIGSKGSGKTTFIRHFKEVFLKNNHKHMYNQCEWIFINMNNAPVHQEIIYDWIIDAILSQIEENHPDKDFKAIETIKKIFRKEINEFEKGLGVLLKSSGDKYGQELYSILSACTKDRQVKLKAYIRFIKEVYLEVPIIALDNCDKLIADQQLLMFDIAQWLRDSFKCLVILPLRDTTYDNYRNRPPLDTVVKDLVFRIDPPDLFKVLQARLEYIVRINTNSMQESTAYRLDNGITVQVKKNEQIKYFSNILQSIRNDRMAMKIFYNLSNRSIRDGIELFINFCKSGHIKAEDILKIRTNDFNEQSNEGQYNLPSYKILNTLLRRNRKYFNEEKSNFANLFASDYSDDLPDPFVRINILNWLKNNYHKEGPSRIKGYHKVSDIVRDLEHIGHKEDIVFREINTLTNRELIFSESQSVHTKYDDLIKISPSGSIHLDLLENVTYLAACAEDTLFKNTSTMIGISRRISKNNYLEKIPLIMTASEMVMYLVDYRNEFVTSQNSYLVDDSYFKFSDLNNCCNAITRFIENDAEAKEIFSYIEAYPKETIIIANIVSKRQNAVSCLVNNQIKGFLSTLDAQYNLSLCQYNNLDIGDTIICKIKEFDYFHRSFQLEYISLKEKKSS